MSLIPEVDYVVDNHAWISEIESIKYKRFMVFLFRIKAK